MQKPFSTGQAKRLISDLAYYADKNMDIAYHRADEMTTRICDAARQIAAQAAISILEDIPVEEVNRDKRGFRVKALRDNGYETIADLARATARELEAVKGIGEDSAIAMKVIVNHIWEEAGKGMKISLSADDRNEFSTALVMAVSQYLKAHSFLVDAVNLHENYSEPMADAITRLKSANGAFKWLFAKAEQKADAVDSYSYLRELLSLGYLERSENIQKNLAAISSETAEDAWADFQTEPIRFFNVLEEIVPELLGNDDSVYGLPEDLAKEIQAEAFDPATLKCTLRRYQEWGVKYILHQKNVLLGDEMGLGKTIQAIAAMVSLRNTGASHFVVVCPASVLINWCREIEKMSDLKVTRVHGATRDGAIAAWMRKGGVAVTTYETVAHFGLPRDFRFELMVVDEAHYVKNRETQRSLNVTVLSRHAERILFMTGTALENKVDEMVSLISMLQPEVAKEIRGMESLASAPRFREIVAPVYYRRKRVDVLQELPELIETEDWLSLNRVEELSYETQVLSKNFAGARRVSWDVDPEDSSKAQRMLEIIEDAESEGRKILVFSFFLDTLAKVQTMLGDRCAGVITGSVPPQKRQEIVDRFEKAPAGSVLVAQIQSGGTGLNIQSASVVILCEPQFKPSVENQAISRAYRLGQSRNVLVHRLLCEDTVDERIMSLLYNKQQIFDAFADESAAAAVESREMDEKTFGNIIQEEIDRIRGKQ